MGERVNTALLAATGTDSQVVTILVVVASVLAGAGVVLLVVRLVMSRRARAVAEPGADAPLTAATPAANIE